MIDDIVTRLRQKAKSQAPLTESIMFRVAFPIMDEAADEIEQLRTVITAIDDLHSPRLAHDTCLSCGHDYPCPTRNETKKGTAVMNDDQLRFSDDPYIHRLVEEIYYLKDALQKATHWYAHLHQVDPIGCEDCEICRETAADVYHAQDERTARFNLNGWRMRRILIQRDDAHE